MPAKNSLQPRAASQVHLSVRIASWMLGSLLLASMGLVAGKMMSDKGGPPTAGALEASATYGGGSE